MFIHKNVVYRDNLNFDNLTLWNIIIHYRDIWVYHLINYLLDGMAFYIYWDDWLTRILVIGLNEKHDLYR